MKALKSIMATATILCLMTSTAQAGSESLRCRLMSKAISETNVTIPGGQAVLSAFRDGGICLFEDGRVADKNFVVANAAPPDFSRGDYAGFSVYTFENGDSLTLSFVGSWGADGNKGVYQVLSGTGAYEGTTGTGTIGNLDSPWEGTNWFAVTLELTVK